jgi:hypothetical protein
MTTHALQFVELSDRDRKLVNRLPSLGEGDTVEVHVRTKGGAQQTLSLPHGAVTLIEAVLDHLSRGDRVAVLSEDQEVTPNEAATILGISRPLVVHRMEVGDLPFRYVGKHRRARLKDVLALKVQLDDQRAAQRALADVTETLMRDHGL